MLKVYDCCCVVAVCEMAKAQILMIGREKEMSFLKRRIQACLHSTEFLSCSSPDCQEMAHFAAHLFSGVNRPSHGEGTATVA